MAVTDPILTLRLPRAALERRDAVARLSVTWQSRALFAFKCDELAFARALLARRTNLWLYRTSQRAFAGDFLVVDVSSPRLEARRATVIELKRGERVRHGRPSSVQLRNAPLALGELAKKRVVTHECSLDALVGDSALVLEWLSSTRAALSCRPS